MRESFEDRVVQIGLIRGAVPMVVHLIREEFVVVVILLGNVVVTPILLAAADLRRRVMRTLGGGARQIVVLAHRRMGVEIREVVGIGAAVVPPVEHRAEGARFPAVAGHRLVQMVVVRGRSPAIPSRVVCRRAGRRFADREMVVADRVRAVIITGRPGVPAMPAPLRGRGAMPAWGVRPKLVMAR